MPSSKSKHSPLPAELPVSLESVHAAMMHLIVIAESTAATVEQLVSDQTATRLRVAMLNQVALKLSRTALELQAARVLALISPTPARLAAIAGASFAGGFIANLAFMKLGLQPFAYH